MIDFMLGLALFVQSNSPIVHTETGNAKYYASGVMERVYAKRLEMKHVTPCPECIGMVALMRREDLNKRVYLCREGHECEGPFLVIDCAGRNVLARRLRQGDVVEVSWQIAQAWQMRGPLKNVTVLWIESGDKK